jgi:hypothetical protein
MAGGAEIAVFFLTGAHWMSVPLPRFTDGDWWALQCKGCPGTICKGFHGPEHYNDAGFVLPAIPLNGVAGKTICILSRSPVTVGGNIWKRCAQEICF